jgi:hypothetical protein
MEELWRNGCHLSFGVLLRDPVWPESGRFDLNLRRRAAQEKGLPEWQPQSVKLSFAR